MNAEVLKQVDPQKQALLKEYLIGRYGAQKKEKKFGVVFDLLHQCDINCRGCGTNAKWTQDQVVHVEEMTLPQIEIIIRKIKEYARIEGLTPFVNFGGGEPFLRDDIIDILRMTSEILGASCVGIDTNASLDQSYELILKAMPYVSYVGISINGLQDYHNWWANNHRIDAFRRAFDTVSRLCEDPVYAEKIEITTVATKKNYRTIPALMEQLKEIGVKNYSVHRAIPVGRMKPLEKELVPNAKEYVELMIEMIWVAKQLGLNAHMHHSVEAIYATTFYGIDTYYSENILNKNYRSSISIDPSGELLIDPWCTVGVWRTLSLGNILNTDLSFKNAFEKNKNILEQLKETFSMEHRCRGCKMKCSGGNRIVAATTGLNGLDEKEIQFEAILDALKEKDPACMIAEQE